MAIETLKNGTPQAARAVMVATIKPLATQSVSISNALGRILAQDITATRNQPPFAASAMDGYGVASQDTPGVLTLIGQSAAGAGFSGTVGRGETVRIFTGAPMPQGADSVVIQEDVSVDGLNITVPACPPLQHVRSIGVDFVAGRTLLVRGQKLDPIALALVAATGLDHVTVRRKPIVAIMSGGDEIVAPGGKPGAFDVFDSITTGLAALIQTWGSDVIALEPKRDKLQDLQNGFQAAFKGADIVVTIGGASVGDRDLMKPALGAFDPQFHVDKVAVRPGKPTWFATTASGTSGTPGYVLGLPGNPASALVCAYLFLKPILDAFGDQPSDGAPALASARLSVALPPNGPREHYLRSVVHSDTSGQIMITPLERQDSSLLSVFQSANALLVLPAGHDALTAGDIVNFVDLERRIT